jgi:hypothetical protein
MAQVVSRRLPTAAARVRAQVRSCGICGGQSGTGAVFLRVLRPPLPILGQPIAPHSSSSSGAGTIGQLVADVPSWLSLTPPQETKTSMTDTMTSQNIHLSSWDTCITNLFDIALLISMFRPFFCCIEGRGCRTNHCRLCVCVHYTKTLWVICRCYKYIAPRCRARNI